MRRPLIMMVLFAAGALATYGYIHGTREPVEASVAPQRLAAADTSEPQADEAETAAAQTAVAASASPTPPSVATASSAAAAPTEDRVGKWIAETSSSDPRTRADAIMALGDAPRARALPALAEVISAADSVDAPLAMGSLKKLAIDQGDSDEGIRSVVRKAIYHGSDDDLASVAQATLSDIEVDLDRADAGARR